MRCSIDELLRALRSDPAETKREAALAREAADAGGCVVSFERLSVDTPEPDGRSRRLVTALTLTAQVRTHVDVSTPTAPHCL